MTISRITPVGVAGATAGAVGTLTMDLLWYWRYRRGGGEANFLEWELGEDTESYEEAGAPAKVGKRLVEGLFQTELPPETARFANTAVHWLTGATWGALHGIVAGSAHVPSRVLGPATGVAAWAASYTVLAPADLYKPMWEYPPKTLWRDLSAHLLYGAVTGAAFRLLTGGGSHTD